MKNYSIEEVNQIIKENDFHSCICNNEKNGEYCFGIDTIQIALEEDYDYFGEFFGDEKNGFEFKFYTTN